LGTLKFEQNPIISRNKVSVLAFYKPKPPAHDIYNQAGPIKAAGSITIFDD
jgi:hypothetical protein